jgi:hypothetical protein
MFNVEVLDFIIPMSFSIMCFIKIYLKIFQNLFIGVHYIYIP